MTKKSKKRVLDHLAGNSRRPGGVRIVSISNNDFETRSKGYVTGEYSCRCHGKRVISAPSKPLKLKLAGHIL